MMIGDLGIARWLLGVRLRRPGVPAFAGMTGVGAGMTEGVADRTTVAVNDAGGCGSDVGRVGMTEGDASRARAN